MADRNANGVAARAETRSRAAWEARAAGAHRVAAMAVHPEPILLHGRQNRTPRTPLGVGVSQPSNILVMGARTRQSATFPHV